MASPEFVNLLAAPVKAGCMALVVAQEAEGGGGMFDPVGAV